MSGGEPFGTAPSGEPVERHVLARDGVRLAVLTWGATVHTLEVPGAGGRPVNVALGFADLATYVEHDDPGPYLGATIGRCANRIAGGRFELDGRGHVLARNDGANALHGGRDAFNRRVWAVEERSAHAIALRRVSPAGEEGYPGTLEVQVGYALLGDGVVELTYAATTDAPTLVNLTNHTVFNLGGEGSGSVDGHELEVAAARYLPVDAGMIPLGPPAPVAGTPLDFTTPALLGARSRVRDAQLAIGRGIDHAFVLDGWSALGVDRGDRALRADGGGALILAARVRDPASGRTLEVHTTEPGLQVYTGNFYDGSLVGTSARTYRQGDGLALETQHHPDAPNRPDFPTTVLRPGERFASRTQWRFTRPEETA